VHKRFILIVEEAKDRRRQLRAMLTRHGMETVECGDSAAAFRALSERHFDLALIGSIRESIWEGLRLAEQIHAKDRQLPLNILIEEGSEELAVAALRWVFADDKKHPVSFEGLDAAVPRYSKAWQSRELPPAVATTRFDMGDATHMIGASPSILRIKSYIPKLAMTDSTVLITGETGTGKELVAASLHRNSPRKHQPFVCLNCAAVPESLLESELFGHEKGAFTGAEGRREGKLKAADGGSLFLDEIGDMSLCTQAKILRAIEAKEVYRLGGHGSVPLNIRFIAATNHNLEELVSEGKFRKDLYFRVNVARIHLLPLRERIEDLPLIIAHYIRELNLRFRREVQGVTEEALDHLLRYPWPGNVRELKNLLEAVFIDLTSSMITHMDLPPHLRACSASAKSERRGEQDRLLSALFSTNWNKRKAAEDLQWSRMKLYRKMAKYRLNPPRRSERPQSRGELG
jgi:DNA-binding NtrC family response regulator